MFAFGFDVEINYFELGFGLDFKLVMYVYRLRTQNQLSKKKRS